MDIRKENSTNSQNEIYWKENCGIAFTLAMIGGRWKINILTFLLNEEKLRYSELKNRLVGVSERMLIAKLKELEKDNLVNRIVHHQVPPKVEYKISEYGKTLAPVLKAMALWGEKHRELKETVSVIPETA